MSRLVIHPEDRSTDFLKPIYEHLDATVVTGETTRHELRKMIDNHDQIIMMGHGTPSGLLSTDKFNGFNVCRHIIDDSFADQLAEHDESIFIWCHADRYLQYNGLRGFHTGMFISELSEAYAAGLKCPISEELKESNQTFTDFMKEVSDQYVDAIFDHIDENYGKVAENNRVARYNHERIYIN